MHSILFQLGPFTLHTYGLMMALGFWAGILVWNYLSKNTTRDSNFISSMLFWILIPAIIGARAAYVVEHWTDYQDLLISILRIDQGGLMFYGGVLGAALGLLAFSRVKKESYLELVDLVIVALPLGHAFGRIGCFLNGCCYGKTCNAQYGVQYPQFSEPWHDHLQAGLIAANAKVSAVVIPNQLYASAVNALIFVLLFWLYKRRQHPGQILAVYLLTYPIARYFLEMLRADSRMQVGQFSISQFLSLALFLLGILLLFVSRNLTLPSQNKETSHDI